MEPSSNAARCKVKFDFCIKSLSMVFNKEVQALDVDKFPIVIVLSKGEHRVATQPTKLLLGKGICIVYHYVYYVHDIQWTPSLD